MASWKLVGQKEIVSQEFCFGRGGEEESEHSSTYTMAWVKKQWTERSVEPMITEKKLWDVFLKRPAK